MIKHVDHINLVVTDLERSVAFYRDVLGMEEMRRAHLEGAWIARIVGLTDAVADVVYLQPRNGGPRLELLHYVSPVGAAFPGNAKANTVGLRHIAFMVDDMEEMLSRLQAAGVEPFSEPVEVPTGVITHSAGHKRLCYFLDPDGVLLELAEYR